MVWTPDDVVKVIGAVGFAAMSIIGALRGTSAQQQSATQAQQINQIGRTLDNHAKMINAISLATPTAAPSAVAVVAAKEDTDDGTA